MRLRARLRLVLVLGSVSAWVAGAAAAERGQPPRYLRNLRMPASNDLFKQPFSVHADLHTGEIFVSDRAENRIAIFDRLGIFRYEITGGSLFQSPLDLAVDPEGFIFLLCRVGERSTLLKLDFDGKNIGEVPIRGLPEGISEVSPTSVALSPAGDRLYIVDSKNHRLWIATREGVVTGSTDLIAGLPEKDAREQIFGHVDAYGDTLLVAVPMLGIIRVLGLDGHSKGDVGIKGTLPCQTAFPVAGALDSQGHVVVLDQQRMAVTVWDPSGNACLMDDSAMGTGPGQFYMPADLALDDSGRIIVSQGLEGRVQLFEYGPPAATP